MLCWWLVYLHTGNIVRLAGLGYVMLCRSWVWIYYNYLRSRETAAVNIMLPYYLLSYGLLMYRESFLARVVTSHLRKKLNCGKNKEKTLNILCLPSIYVEEGAKGSEGIVEILNNIIWPYLWFCQTLQQSESVYKSEITFINSMRERRCR